MKSVSLLLTIFLLLTITSILNGQMNWIKHAENPIMSGDDLGTWNNHVWWPNVIYNSDSARYEMWYGGAAGPVNNWYPNPLGFATSADGINWVKRPNPVLEGTPGTWDAFAVQGQTVIRENGSYKMWYVGFKHEEDSGGIGYATSDDGIVWTKDTLNNPIILPSQTWEEMGFITVHIMPVESGYKMWYCAAKEEFSNSDIGYATSENGLVWMKDTLNSPVIQRGEAGRWESLFLVEPHVIIIDDVYYMFFVGSIDPNYNNLRQTGLAYSMDGINWIKYDDPTTTSNMYVDSDPILNPVVGQWDGNYIQAGTVMIEGDSLRMWYSGSREPTGTSEWRIGHATIKIDSLRKYTVLNIEESRTDNKPDGFMLSQNYPNPFNPVTSINYQLTVISDVDLSVFNVLGQKIATLVNDQQSAGSHQVQWDASGFAAGIYYYKIETGEFQDVKKMILLR